jgi:hypothetical protein
MFLIAYKNIKKFRWSVHKKLNKNINDTNKLFDTTYDNMNIKRQVYLCKCPLYVSIKLKKVASIDTYTKDMCVVESATQYEKIILPEIKKSVIYNIVAILLFVARIIKNNLNPENLKLYNSIYELIDDENMKEYIKNNIFLKHLFGRNIMYNDNFYIVNKVHMSNSYVLWYLPSFTIEIKYLYKIFTIMKTLEMNYKKQLNLQENIDVYINENINKHIIEYLKLVNADKTIKEIIVNNSTYCNIYKNDINFIYNMRHLNYTHIPIISSLLETFIGIIYKNKLNLENSNNIENIYYSAYKNKYYLYCHYPNNKSYGVFHMHITCNSDLNLLQTEDITKSNVKDSTRIFLWEYIKNKFIIDNNGNSNICNKDIYTNVHISYKYMLGKNKIYKNIVSQNELSNTNIELHIQDYNT